MFLMQGNITNDGGNANDNDRNTNDDGGNANDDGGKANDEGRDIDNNGNMEDDVEYYMKPSCPCFICSKPQTRLKRHLLLKHSSYQKVAPSEC